MFPELRAAFARIGILFALLLGALGQFITFAPGFQLWWFGTAASAAALGVVSPNWRFKVMSAALAIGLALLSWSGYQQGLRYQEFLRQHQEFLRDR